MKGIVYCIECKDTGGKYIGSTTKKLNWRMLKHKSDVNQYDKGNTNKKCTVYYIIKNGNYKSYILEEVEYEVTKDLHKKELEYIEKISQQNKDYNEKNKEKIKERKSKVIECECGVSYTFGHKARHFNSARHINYI